MKYFYKYRVNGKFTDDIITNSRFYMASPNDFNDPFDCKAPISFECTTDELKAKLFQVAKKFEPHSSRHDIRSRVREVMKDKVKMNGYRKYMISSHEEHIANLGVFCLSEKNDDILMWSHYADLHRGICLEFDFSTFRENLIPHPINYSEAFPSLNYFRTSPDEMDKGVLFWKSSAWSYEKEWRIARGEIKNRLVTFPEGMLSGIVFGCKVDQKTIDHYLTLCNSKKKPITFYQAKKRSSEFALDVVQFD